MWKGTICSQASAVGRSEEDRRFRGHASPMDVEAMVVREGGQIGARPSIRTDQRMGRGTMGIEEARVLGWERR